MRVSWACPAWGFLAELWPDRFVWSDDVLTHNCEDVHRSIAAVAGVALLQNPNPSVGLMAAGFDVAERHLEAGGGGGLMP